ncbi:MAG: glucose-6-phosphate isomerase [Bacilli bacterium]|nr:glucose-6-phosphate isomerase [Bacilli bacterium]
MIKFDFIKNYDFDFDMDELSKYEMTGWRRNFTDDLTDIYKLRDKVKTNSDVLVVIGIGGSFLGSKCIYDMFSPYFKKGFEVIYAGYSLSSDYLNDLVNYLKDKDFSINVISKSGSTMEIKITYDVLKDLLIEKYGDNIQDRVIVTTGDKGFLMDEVNNYGFYKFPFPEDIGGRYSMFTYAHLFPLSFAIDIEEFIKGFNDGDNLIKEAYSYALNRYNLFKEEKVVENFVCYEEKYLMFMEWIKQLFGESEGKSGNGVFPVSTLFTKDLHSLGQFIQDGNNIMFETILVVRDNKEIKDVNKTNNIVIDSVREAHRKGGVESNLIEIDKLNLYDMGSLVKFFFYAAAFSAIKFGVNPFDQPGVEVYKSEIKNNL